MAHKASAKLTAPTTYYSTSVYVYNNQAYHIMAHKPSVKADSTYTLFFVTHSRIPEITA